MASAAAACAGVVIGLLALLGPARAAAASVDAPPPLKTTDEGADLLVFVGEKLSVQDVTEQIRSARQQESGKIFVLMDGIYRARYRVKQVVYGRYDSDTIEFNAADHYGVPPFSLHDTVLLFVSKDEGGYYQQKYQYYPVFRTVSGGWAGCGAIGPGDAEERATIPPPHVMDFGPDAYFDLRKLDWRIRRQDFDRQAYVFERGRARCRLGHSLEELFQAKQRTVLKARGLFAEPAAP
ncbi:hypothetical protein [Lysobacter silvisoli]|uniref:Uncharacterized protein n=1 Tax=Lysobacter silvisoli TaxID=2293254 RepID=A0A371JZ35_9GAMM|nr:hypothetical protein [Lysobacter silvisoli]RDZ26926.1 hypothetical protein DX914_11665 [Lysobacter silvisoli]